MKVTPQVIGKAVAASFGKFDYARKNRGKFLSQVATRFAQRSKPEQGDNEDRKASPLNMLHTGVTTLVPNLVWDNPKGRAKSLVILYRDYAEKLELATNDLIRKINLKMTLRKATFDACFMAGFVKTGLADGDSFLTLDGRQIPIGQPYADRVDPDDMVLDPWARDWEEQSFMGNRFRADLDDLEATGLYDMDMLRKLTRSHENKRYASKLSGDVGAEYSEVREFVDLCEVYLPREKLVVTIPYYSDGKVDDFLRVADFVGPDTGPYHMLGFTQLSDNLLPVPPVAHWYDMHILGNRIARKLARQAERLKRVLAYQGEAQEDVEEIADADDGETVRVADVNLIKELTFGGAAPESYEWMEWVKRNFSEQAGSLDMLSGTGANTPTLGQAEILQANTSVRLGDMQASVQAFATEVVRDLAFFLHTDPLIELPLVQRKGGQDVQIVYTPEMRQGNFFDFNLSIDAYSMGRPDPNMAIRRKMEFLTNALPAAAQAAMLLGPGFKLGVVLKDLARELQFHEFDEWFDEPAIQAWIMQKINMSLATGDPGKAGQDMGMPPAGGMNPAQPVPTMMGPTGGVTPEAESNMAQQESSAELQAARGGSRPSTKALASMA